jgi:hypothetical protein
VQLEHEKMEKKFKGFDLNNIHPLFLVALIEGTIEFYFLKIPINNIINFTSL